MKIPKITGKIIVIISSIIIALCAFMLIYTGYDYVTTYRAQQTKITETKTFVLQAEAESIQDLAIVLQKKVKRGLLFVTTILFLLSIIISKAYTGNRQSLWFVAISFPILLAINIVLIWNFQVQSGKLKMQSNVVENNKDVEAFFAIHKQQNPNIYKTKAYHIPIGFLFYSIEVGKQNHPHDDTVTLYCYPWLTYDKEKDKDIKGTFIVMNATKEVSWAQDSLERENKLILNWQEQIQIRGNFDYAKYPFDQQQITLSFEHNQSLKNILLTPDFDAYKVATIPYPQLDKSIMIPGWTITNAYFYYDLSNYPTDFGIPNYWQIKNYPFLSYTIQIQRNFFEPLITSLLPILIILFIVFASLIILSRLINVHSSINGLLALLSSLFFANLVSYQTLQRAISTPNITYFKAFYMITYAIIFMAALNCLLYAYRPNFFVNYEKNFLPRLLYWPLATTIFFAITLYFF
ncbi:MAG: hypothetical protein M1114_03210 [Candidatus Dependentiae bacterium]|nr:hypothetical protein [Candidatus Dependentiae bacterium]